MAAVPRQDGVQRAAARVHVRVAERRPPVLVQVHARVVERRRVAEAVFEEATRPAQRLAARDGRPRREDGTALLVAVRRVAPPVARRQRLGRTPPQQVEEGGGARGRGRLLPVLLLLISLEVAALSYLTVVGWLEVGGAMRGGVRQRRVGAGRLGKTNTDVSPESHTTQTSS